MSKPLEFIERIFDSLITNPLNTIGALAVLVVAIPLIRSALKDDKPDPPPAPHVSSPIEIESPWFVQNFLQMQDDVGRMKEQLALLSSKIDGIAKLLRKRAGQKSK